LSNLTETGQMVIDSQNGAISNCILDIPQNIKLTLENNVVTLKVGSTVVRGGEVYTTYTLSEDKSLTISSSLENGRYFLYTNSTGTPLVTIQNKFGSGTTLPADSSVYGRFFITTNKTFYNWSGAQNAWVESGVTYPIAMIDVVNGIASFAKDSNGNDMIFNGAGFIGHHAFVYPNVKALIPNGFNEYGSLKSTLGLSNSLSIIEMTGTAPDGYDRYIYTTNGRGWAQFSANEVNDISELSSDSSNYYSYVKNKNYYYHIVDNIPVAVPRLCMVKFVVSGATVTDFTIRQPVRLATTEMTDKIQAQVDTNTTAISGKQDTLVSGTNIKTINSTTVLGNGNFALADQSLSNLDSNGQMIIDSQNGTISNCVLEIPQNIKLELSNNVLTLKAGSIVTRTGSTYATYTTTQDLTWGASTQTSCKQYVFISNSGTPLGLYNAVRIEKVGSGSSLPADGSTYSTFFNTTDKIVYVWNETTWAVSNHAYPLAIIDVDSQGNMSFAKDSNGNDMIFNGAGFVGHHAFVYPNVKSLIANGFNADGTLKSTDTTLNSLQIRSLTASRTNATVCLGLNTINAHRVYTIVDDVSEITTDDYNIWYVRNENQMYLVQNSQIDILNETMLITYSMDSSYNVTDFTIRKPVRTATVEMLNSALGDIDEQVKQNTTDISTKQADLTTASGYDATATQVLKNINGVLTWVTEE
jgi:hypothetical protein